MTQEYVVAQPFTLFEREYKIDGRHLTDADFDFGHPAADREREIAKRVAIGALSKIAAPPAPEPEPAPHV